MPSNRFCSIFVERRAALIGVFRQFPTFLIILCTSLWVLFWPDHAWAQARTSGALVENSAQLPLYWFLITSFLALFVPIGFILVGVAGLEAEYAWNAALGGLAAISLAIFAYWAVGFALHFGGIGLVYTEPALQQLVWEWSPLSTNWGTGWGVAGLSGWFLSGPQVTAFTYTLFLAHLPWVVTAAMLPAMALRGRAPAIVTLVLALLIGGIIYPLAGNWVQGGGWLSALGRNLNLGHGFVDFGGAGTVHLFGAGFALAALVVWIPRRQAVPLAHLELPPVHLPLLVVVGSLFILVGSFGWYWANPLQVARMGELALMRGSVNSLLIAAGGLVPPLFYTWFVTGRSDPMLCARGLVAGVVAGLAVGPFVQPGVAFAIGLLAGATVPFAVFVIEGIWLLDDATGVVTASGIPAMVGLLFVGIFADGVVGQGWQLVGETSYLGVAGQGVTGLFVVSGYQANFPAQLQAQAIGVLTMSLWGFLTGMLCCIPLGLLFHTLQHSDPAPHETVGPLAPFAKTGFDVEAADNEWVSLPESEGRPRR